MTLHARSDLAYVSLGSAHGGCGIPHRRPVEQGAPVKVWSLTCAPCEQHLITDPMWSATIADIPESPDEVRSREDWEKRGERDVKILEAIGAARNAGMPIPETLLRALSTTGAHHFGRAASSGLLECAEGHACDPGSKFCGECGAPVLRPAVCPNGHEMAAKAKFCGECGAAVAAAPPAAAPLPAMTAPPAPPDPGQGSARKKPLKDMRADDLRKMARDRGLDDSGTRAELLARLRPAA